MSYTASLERWSRNRAIAERVGAPLHAMKVRFGAGRLLAAGMFGVLLLAMLTSRAPVTAARDAETTPVPQMILDAQALALKASEEAYYGVDSDNSAGTLVAQEAAVVVDDAETKGVVSASHMQLAPAKPLADDVPYRETFIAEAKRVDMPPSLLAGLALYESGWNPKAVSSAGARGLCQFMKGSWEQFTIGQGWSWADAYDAEKSIWAAATYLSYLRQVLWETVDTEKELAYAMCVSYCWGIGNVRDHGANAAPSDVKAYAANIVHYAYGD